MTIVCESNGARLTEERGRLVCACPFACLATYEPCEFAGPCGHVHSPHVPWWRRVLHKRDSGHFGGNADLPPIEEGQA